MQEDITINRQPTNDPQYLVHNDFLQRAYKWLENWDKPYISVDWNDVSYPVYNLYIAKFLMSKVVEVYPVGHTINGTDYLKSFAEGYNAGKVQFDQRWPLGVFQGDNADCHFNDLHRLYCHEPNQIFEGDGWLAAAKYIPDLINHTAVKYYGFFCAKIAGCDHIVHNYEALFNKLLKCEHALIESKSDDVIGQFDSATLNIPTHNLFIIPEARNRLYEAIKPLVEVDENGEQPALKDLILDGKAPKTPIIFTGLLKTFGLSFYTSKAVPAQGAKILSEQLPKYFRRNVGNEILDLKPSILVKHLRGKQD